MKQCTVCHTEKELSDFNFERRRRAYYSACKACHRAACKRSEARKPEQYKASRRAKLERQRQANPTYYRDHSRKTQRKLRATIIAEYGGKCRCCGITEPAFLAIDHVNNDGAAHRKTIGTSHIYWWLKKNGYPKDEYQLLCHNCNMAKAFYGECPHRATADLGPA